MFFFRSLVEPKWTGLVVIFSVLHVEATLERLSLDRVRRRVFFLSSKLNIFSQLRVTSCRKSGKTEKLCGPHENKEIGIVRCKLVL